MKKLYFLAFIAFIFLPMTASAMCIDGSQSAEQFCAARATQEECEASTIASGALYCTWSGTECNTRYLCSDFDAATCEDVMSASASCAWQPTSAGVSVARSAFYNMGSDFISVFFGILPTILLYVVPIILVLWGIRWIISYFHRGGKR